MRGMNSETVDLIYLDPPFNANRNYAAPIGSDAADAAFKDTWTLDDVDHPDTAKSPTSAPALYAITGDPKTGPPWRSSWATSLSLRRTLVCKEPCKGVTYALEGSDATDRAAHPPRATRSRFNHPACPYG